MQTATINWGCYSCKEHHYWDGYTKLQEGKSRLSEGMIGDEYALSSGVHHSLTVENRKTRSSFNSFSIKGLSEWSL